MAIEKGTDEKSEKNETHGFDMMQAFLEMKKELAELREQKNPQAAILPIGAGGLSTDQFAELMSTVVKGIKEKPDTEKYDVRKFIDERDIDKNDYDESGVLFCSYSTGYLIVDDVRQGMPVRTPYGNNIFFIYQATNRHQIGKHTELSTYSSYISHSKKEQEWLREHRYFGVMFFESVKEALSVDSKKATKLVRLINNMNNMNQHQILMSCKSNGIPISDNIKIMRTRLAHKLAEIEAEAEERGAEKKFVEMNESLVFEGNKG